MIITPRTLLKASLIKRINRFVAEVSLNDVKINVYVPNTGRLSELALPGAEVLLSPINAKYRYKILYIINRSFPVMIDSTFSNRLFYDLLKVKKVPGLEQYSTIKREPVFGNHRFDFLVRDENKELYIELKSCTLFYNRTGSFPDAVSSRASEHVKALAETGKGKLIFLVLKSDIEIFLPNYHTDFAFYETLKKYKSRIDIHAFTVQYDHSLNIQSLKEIPVIIPDVKPEGLFLLVLLNPEDTLNSEGELFEQGYYIYCGTSTVNIFRTIGSLKTKNGLNRIFPCMQFSKMKIVSDLPVINSSFTIDQVKTSLSGNGGSAVTFPGTDIISGNELVHFKNNPLEQSWFWNLMLEIRFKNCTQ